MVEMVKQRLTSWQWVAAAAILAVLIWLAQAGAPDGKLHVYFLDVGQGDAILIVAPDGRQILVDGGPSPTALFNELGAVLPFWDRDLDLVVLTHPDGDHITGLLPLFDRYRVAQVLDTSLSDVTPVAAAWRAGLAQHRIGRTLAVRGMRIPVGQMQLTVLHPAPQALQGTASDDNNNAIALRLDSARTSLLLTGDAESEAEADMLRAGLPLKADLIKIGHHGSRGSTSAPFLAAVAPRWAVIQVGADNAFGHPHPEVAQRLQAAGAEVLRTDRQGRIAAISDGRTWQIRPALWRHPPETRPPSPLGSPTK
ncbi:MAG: MBL fold metallo-hydrolase [Anaerolineae bacterium]|nr:MBL fold metallo-hydrolase [Anaerolineae bacterium]